MDVVALGELLIDFTENGVSGQGNPLFEANPGGAPCNVLATQDGFYRKSRKLFFRKAAGRCDHGSRDLCSQTFKG